MISEHYANRQRASTAAKPTPKWLAQLRAAEVLKLRQQAQAMSLEQEQKAARDAFLPLVLAASDDLKSAHKLGVAPKGDARFARVLGERINKNLASIVRCLDQDPEDLLPPIVCPLVRLAVDRLLVQRAKAELDE